MLRELHIQNLAVIESARIELGPGLNIFTGQTGAGKSLVLGAIQSLLGMKKAASKSIRAGCDQARISGVFEITSAESAEQAGLALDLDLLPGDELLLTRKLLPSGRSSLTANGQPITAAMAKAAAEALIDIHGQHDHQALMRKGKQLDLLDRFARCLDLRQSFAECYRQWSSLRDQREQLLATSELRTQQLDLYRFQLDEIDAADPVAGEMAELLARERVLSSLSRIKQDAGSAYAALYDSEGSVTERLQALTGLLLELADIDENLAPTAEQVRTATLTLQESAFDLSRYTERLDLDPQELAEVEGRLNTLNRLIQKYGDGRSRTGADDALAPVLQHRQHLAEQIDQLASQTTQHAEIDEQITACEAQMQKLGEQLSAKRQAAAKKIGPKVQRQLADLGMKDATLRVQVACESIQEATASGLDRVEIMARTNPGQDERPLREIASGGELSRVMLAIKSVMAASRRPSDPGGGVDVLVFDEIDANIGGRLGDIIGRKLRQLAPADDESRQVLCITHLPQIAAFADRHLHITKQVTGSGKSKRTDTTVIELQGKARVDELAEMLAGSKTTRTSLKQARELLAASSTDE